MNNKVVIIGLVSSALLLSGCNFFGIGGNKNTRTDETKPEPTPFQREYDLDQKSENGMYNIVIPKDEKLKIGFEVRGADKKINKGTINVKEGSAVVEDGILKSASVVLDMNSVKIEKGDTSLETAIKSSDYFDVSNNPELKLKIIPGNKIPTSPNDNLNYEAIGELTVRGQTKETKFDASVIETSENVITVGADVDVAMDSFGAPTISTLNKRFVLNTNFNFIKG